MPSHFRLAYLLNRLGTSPESSSNTKALNDDVALSSLETEIAGEPTSIKAEILQDAVAGGLIVMGIDMSKGKKVKVKQRSKEKCQHASNSEPRLVRALRLVHAASDTPQRVPLGVHSVDERICKVGPIAQLAPGQRLQVSRSPSWTRPRCWM
jgi:hypothetical protein